MKPEVILWGYVVLLLIGGVIGYVKAKSPISLIMSLLFGALLALSAAGKLGPPWVGDILLIALIGVFAKRFQKTKKLMPAGVLTLVTIAALLVRAMMMLG